MNQNREILKRFETELESIASEWNGDEPGRGEERAGLANEAIEHVKALEMLFTQLGY